MLLQSGDDGFDNTTIALLPAWPCGWDVQFKLRAPLNTSVEVVYSGGIVRSLRVEVSGGEGAGDCAMCSMMLVQPQERESSVKWGGCVH